MRNGTGLVCQEEKIIFIKKNMKEKILSMLKELQPSFEFEDNVDFIEAGYLDSFDVIQLVSMLESEFNVLISALEIVPENFGSVEAICHLVEKSVRRDV